MGPKNRKETPRNYILQITPNISARFQEQRKKLLSLAITHIFL